MCSIVLSLTHQNNDYALLQSTCTMDPVVSLVHCGGGTSVILFIARASQIFLVIPLLCLAEGLVDNE